MTSLFDLLTIEKYNQVVFCPYIVFTLKITFAFRSSLLGIKLHITYSHFWVQQRCNFGDCSWFFYHAFYLFGPWKKMFLYWLLCTMFFAGKLNIFTLSIPITFFPSPSLNSPVKSPRSVRKLSWSPHDVTSRHCWQAEAVHQLQLPRLRHTHQLGGVSDTKVLSSGKNCSCFSLFTWK